MIASGVEAFNFSPDGQALFITHGDTLQLSLTWLSLATDSATEQLIAGTYGGAVLRGNQRAVIMDRWNSQDETGDLELIDIPSGTRQVLAHAVADVAGSGSIDGAARVLYVVRGRFASGQDGLWQTTLPTP